MKISNVEVISFSGKTRFHRTRWGYGVWGEERDEVQGIVKIETDDGAEGYFTGGQSYFVPPSPEIVEHLVKPLLVGEDPLNREKLWQWMMGHRGLSESVIGAVDCALWDLMGRTAGVSVASMLGQYRSKVKAYASTAPNLGSPDIYAAHALACKKRGYTAYKVHANIYWDPEKKEPAPGKPAFPQADLEICQAVREAVGDEMVLMLDPWGIYTYEESLYVGRELEKLNYYWFEHPMDERKTEPYRKLTEQLDIVILGPEMEPGSLYTRAEWAILHASDMGRIDTNFGGITGCHKALGFYESIGMQCEIHVGGFGNLALLGSSSEETCEYYERGLLRHDEDYDSFVPPYLKEPCDPMDEYGYVSIPQGPGLGMQFEWDYINDNRVGQ
ncbi:MAG: enolase [Chloroflexi bacterium]|nr:enolase [Chloroflexota bacterium]